jgi:hypothetical protein
MKRLFVIILTICLFAAGCAVGGVLETAPETTAAETAARNNLPFETASAGIITSTSGITAETASLETEGETLPADVSETSGGTTAEIAIETSAEVRALSTEDETLLSLFERQESGVQVRGRGVVTQILADDNEGGRHQRFILRLESGQTLLIAHNIDIAPRLDGLAAGDDVEFYGEYYYSEEGGGVHWTHSDPDGSHIAGYLKWNGDIYQEIEQTAAVNTAAQADFIGNVNSLTLHAPDCDNLPNERNRVYFSGVEEALEQGYHKHGACLGD